MPLPRRTFLRGAGIAMALPMLDAMVPTFRRTTEGATDPSLPPRRMIAIQTNMGILSQHFFPKSSGPDFESTAYLDLLKDFRSKLTLFSGVSHPDVDGAHEAERSFLSAAPHPGGAGFKNSISLPVSMYSIAHQCGQIGRFVTIWATFDISMLVGKFLQSFALYLWLISGHLLKFLEWTKE